MNHRISKLVSLGLVVIFCWAIPLVVTASDVNQTMKAKVTHYAVSMTYIPVGDQPGHVLGVTRRAGQAVLDIGETAKYSSVYCFDFSRSKGGKTEGYTKFDFDDGSNLEFSWIADTSVDSNGHLIAEGKGKIFSGAGRFKNIEGTSVFTGKEEQPGTITAEATITYTIAK